LKLETTLYTAQDPELVKFVWF